MNSDGNQRQIDGDKIFWGLLLVAAGTFMLLGRLGIADFSWTLRKFWPLWAGLWMITLGAWLQAVTLHFHGFTYESSWPLLLIILGAGVIVRTLAGAAQRRDADESENNHV
jgi:hypothetical protein